MDLQFVTLDVFTSTRLEGNPLAVVSVPAALKGKLSQETKQKIAQEFNLSETIFLHENDDPEATQRDIDIFTIGCEVPFAGHPTVGTAVLVKYHLQPTVDTLIAKSGLIGIETAAANYVRAKIPHDVHLHARTLADVVAADHPHLSRHPAIREAELRAPVFSIVNGMTFLMVGLPSLDELKQVEVTRFNAEELESPLLDKWWRDSLVCRYYYVDVGGRDGKRCLRTRMVVFGIEDPATGSAATALGAFLTLTEEKKGREFEITQGIEMGRKSVMSVETTVMAGADKKKGEMKLGDIWLGGTAVVVMKGGLTVDI